MIRELSWLLVQPSLEDQHWHQTFLSFAFLGSDIFMVGFIGRPTCFMAGYDSSGLTTLAEVESS